MAIDKRVLGTIGLFTLVLMVSFAISFKLSLQNRALTPNAPESNPLACEEHCPGSNGNLMSCTPPEADGTPAESECSWVGRTEICGNQPYCCPSAGGTWTRDMTACCVDSTWTPATSTVCPGTNVTQTSNCGTTRVVDGTKITGCEVVCEETMWKPTVDTVCVGTNLTQTSNCGGTREVEGTKTTGECACVDTTWSPNPALTCTTGTLTQTSNCGTERSVTGTKNCCIDKTWSPTTASTCSEKTLTQTSNCGSEREVDGTKTCLPDLSIVTNAFLDDTRNKPGVYFTDKKTTKVSRDQFYVYTMEVKNQGTGSAKDFVISDTLTGQNQSLIAFIDGEERCNFDSPKKKLSCEVDTLKPNETIKLRFRVKVAQLALNGKVIRNTAKVNYNNKTKEGSVEVLVSSIVSCNENCTSDSECVAGLACDVFSDKCRKPACSQSTSCSCTPTATVTKKPTATATIKPTSSQVDFPDSSLATPSSSIALAEETLEDADTLPETGIFDFPQTAVFGGGILLAILGLFLAL